MNCWVNKGAQGIALIDEEGVHRSGLKYVFDVTTDITSKRCYINTIRCNHNGYNNELFNIRG